MYTYILKRCLLAIPMLFGITFISFLVMQLAPGQVGGGTGGEMSATRLTRDQWRVMNETFYLDKPVYLRYFFWLGIMQSEPSPETKMQWKQEDEERAARNLPSKSHLRGVIHGDLGYSMETHSVTVWERLRDAVPITILLNTIAFFVIYLVAIPIGIYSATHPYTLLDRITTIGAFMLFSLPSFWVALMMILFMVKLPPQWRLPFNGLEPVGADRLPTLSYFAECSKHLILPIIAMSHT